MAWRWLAAGIIAVFQWAGTVPSGAADLYSPYDPPRAEAPEEEGPYRGLYRLPPPPPYVGPRYGEPRYGKPPYGEPRFAEPPYREPYPPRRYADRDEDSYGPRELYRGEPPYGFRPPERGVECLPRREIRRALRQEGWGDFELIELRGDIAILQATRPSGRLFVLKVDRCSGHIVDVRPAEEEGGRYAWRRREPYPTY
jgi:hypothetical protein